MATAISRLRKRPGDSRTETNPDIGRESEPPDQCQRPNRAQQRRAGGGIFFGLVHCRSSE